MNLLYIGAGFVGACSAAASAEMGHNTLIFDINADKITALGSGEKEQIERWLFERGLSELLQKNNERVAFTSEYQVVEQFLDTCDAIFLCLPTPEVAETGESDLTYYRSGLLQLASALEKRNGGEQTKYIALVNKSTVPINMAEETARVLTEHKVAHVGVVSNPEFLVEGKAIEGALHPDRIVVGAWNEKDFEIMKELYAPLIKQEKIQYIEVNPKEAAAGKLLANYYLFAKLALCFDIVGRTAESFQDVRFESLRKVLTTDARIGTWGFYDSLYAGGSCLIKDTRSLEYQLRQEGVNTDFVQETYTANKRQLESFLARAHSEARVDWKGKKVALLGTSFKRDTNDVRNSASELIVEFCVRHDATVSIFDPSGMSAFAQRYPASAQLRYDESEAEAIADANIIIISTDWPQFEAVSELLLDMTSSEKPLIMDGRRMLAGAYPRLQQAGFDIIAVGSPFLPKHA